jgi:hypothetical protein
MMIVALLIGIARFVSGSRHGAYEERAAIMQYEAGMGRADAERKAREDVRTYAQRSAEAMERQRGLFDG